jgi:WD40 repeat protein
VTFSPNGRTLAVGSISGTATLWDVRDPAHPQQLDLNLATVNGDNTATLWDVHDAAHPQRLGSPLTGHTGAR